MFSYTNSYISTGLLLIIALVGLRCEHVGPLEVDSEAAPTLSNIQSLFTQNCATSACHTGPNALLGLDLSDGQSFQNLVGVSSLEAPSLQLVSPNFPDSSYLILKIEGSAKIAAGTMQMPIGRSPLKDSDIERIRAWITEGALDN